MMTVHGDELSNALIHQKNRLLYLINQAIEMKDADLLDHAEHLLYFAEELWTACDYTYKFQEIQQRIKAAIEIISPVYQ